MFILIKDKNYLVFCGGIKSATMGKWSLSNFLTRINCVTVNFLSAKILSMRKVGDIALKVLAMPKPFSTKASCKASAYCFVSIRVRHIIKIATNNYRIWTVINFIFYKISLDRSFDKSCFYF